MNAPARVSTYMKETSVADAALRATRSPAQAHRWRTVQTRFLSTRSGLAGLGASLSLRLKKVAICKTHRISSSAARCWP